MSKKLLLTFFIGNWVFLSLLVGCIDFKRNTPEKRFFMLDTDRREKPSSSQSDAALRILRFRVSPRFDGKGFVHRKGNMRYDSDYYNEFLIPPGLMIAEEVNKWLTASSLFQYVIGSYSLIEPTFGLEAMVVGLYGDYRDIKAPKAVLELQFFLLKNFSSVPEIVLGKTYHQQTPLKGHSPEALVEGWNRALEHILSEFEADLIALDLKKGEMPVKP